MTIIFFDSYILVWIFFAQPISRDLRRELYSRRIGDGVPKRKSRKEANKENKANKEGDKENQKATSAQTEPKANVAKKL